MKKLILVVLITFSTSAHAVTVIFDIDWTLLYRDQVSQQAIESDSILVHDKDVYRISDYAVQVIELLLRRGVNVQFFSGGNADRNEYFIRVLNEKINRIAKEPRVLPQAFSKESLTEVLGPASGLDFFDRTKKNLLTVVSPAELENTVIIDDDRKFRFDSQREHWIHLTTYQDFLEYPSATSPLPMI